ncbi:VOC family protein [Streptomyces johnsoniae]|uniref:VOC family protein n=1 Tax=Streptomyces johnsoniae TaxID=3075532 RepID=A0ABU2S8I7_9ACTN|nr:VOC family protein [Streptomyces sp. DSM 41886]MDT0445286.1 VOC family protein [Streptomyces sp. DSM 41886]
MGSKQLKVGLRVRDLERSRALYLKCGFKEIPNGEQLDLRYLTFGHTWLILSDLSAHPYHAAEREQATKQGPLGRGFVLTIPSKDIDQSYRLWQDEGLPVTAEPMNVGWASVFFGLDPDGYDVMFEHFHE